MADTSFSKPLLAIVLLMLSLSASLADNRKVKENRIGEPCSKDDISLSQGTTSPLPSGIPTYTVEIINTCTSGCTVSNIHVSCGSFSSARTINPGIFRRISYDDCLVNDGNVLSPGGSLSFQYANAFSYPLRVSSIVCN